MVTTTGDEEMKNVCKNCGAINSKSSKHSWVFVGKVACCGKCGSTNNELNKKSGVSRK